MSSPSIFPAFSVYGIELEYMIVDHNLNVMPIAEKLLHDSALNATPEAQKESLEWSNELVSHVVELKNTRPTTTLENLPGAFQSEISRVNRLLKNSNAQLMPTAMHPWMNPVAETQLWTHSNAQIYETYHRIFNCKSQGWANLQSMHVNLPFADDKEFIRLHAAIRLTLPILPALAASSPICHGENTRFMDYRMEVYRTNAAQIPSLTGQVVPEMIASPTEYQSKILEPMYRDIAPYDPQGILQYEWLNSRGAIPRFERNAIEIRVIDMQECPKADFAIAAAAIAVVKALYDDEVALLTSQQNIATESLAQILYACNRDAERAVIDNPAYLAAFNFPGKRCEVSELWQYLAETALTGQTSKRELWREALGVIFRYGPLARRILQTIKTDYSREHLQEIYRQLCVCSDQGKMFV